MTYEEDDIIDEQVSESIYLINSMYVSNVYKVPSLVQKLGSQQCLIQTHCYFSYQSYA